nr:BV-like protein [Cotesia vestalis bracovirus]
MQLSSNTMVILLIAAFESLWLQDTSVSAAPYLGDLNFSHLEESFEDRMNRLYGLDNSDKARKGQINYFGSRTYQKDNVYEGIDKKHAVFGSRDVQIGNSYSGDPDATNVFAPILVQENNTYRGKNTNAQYGASVVRSGNSYPHNSGKNIFDPIVIQSNNTYEDNIKNSSTLKPEVKPSRHNHHPSQHVHDLSASHIGLGMQIKEHEEMSKIILNNLKTDQSSSKRCANGKMNSERLDDINSLYLEVQGQVAQLKALKRINRSRKLLCDAIPNECSKHDHVRRWIFRTRRIVMTKANQSKLRWESLRKC